jgi:hypothetical protein
MKTQKSENNAGVPSASHTPGPWLLYTDKFDPDMCAQVYIRGAAIADIYADNILPTGQGMANARLIAAAPELLNLVKNILPMAIKTDAGGQWVADARAAIAKATGR